MPTASPDWPNPSAGFGRTRVGSHSNKTTVTALQRPSVRIPAVTHPGGSRICAAMWLNGLPQLPQEALQRSRCAEVLGSTSLGFLGSRNAWSSPTVVSTSSVFVAPNKPKRWIFGGTMDHSAPLSLTRCGVASSSVVRAFLDFAAAEGALHVSAAAIAIVASTREQTSATSCSFRTRCAHDSVSHLPVDNAGWSHASKRRSF